MENEEYITKIAKQFRLQAHELRKIRDSHPDLELMPHGEIFNILSFNRGSGKSHVSGSNEGDVKAGHHGHKVRPSRHSYFKIR